MKTLLESILDKQNKKKIIPLDKLISSYFDNNDKSTWAENEDVDKIVDLCKSNAKEVHCQGNKLNYPVTQIKKDHPVYLFFYHLRTGLPKLKKLYKGVFSGQPINSIKSEVFDIAINKFTDLGCKSEQNYVDGTLMARVVNGTSYWVVDAKLGDLIWSHLV